MSLPRLFWRPAGREDIPTCLQMLPLESGEDLLGLEAAVLLWSRLIALPATRSVVIEADRPVHGSTLVGFGSASFVTQAFAEDALAHPRPGLNRRVLQGLAQGKLPIPGERELRRDNTIGGLSLLTMAGHIRPACEDNIELVRAIGLMLPKAFCESFIGFRLRRLLFEVSGQVMRQRFHRMKLYRIEEYPQPRSASSPLGYVVVDRDAAFEHEGSLFAQLFDYREPCLRLSPAEQALLEVAKDKTLTDRELANLLGLTVECIRSRWRTALPKAAKLLPHVAARLATGGATKRSRGLQRRHHLLDYIRAHREELRPFDWGLWDRTQKGRVA
jgi:hypothetical protein